MGSICYSHKKNIVGPIDILAHISSSPSLFPPPSLPSLPRSLSTSCFLDGRAGCAKTTSQGQFRLTGGAASDGESVAMSLCLSVGQFRDDDRRQKASGRWESERGAAPRRGRKGARWGGDRSELGAAEGLPRQSHSCVAPMRGSGLALSRVAATYLKAEQRRIGTNAFCLCRRRREEWGREKGKGSPCHVGPTR